jgi:NADH-quinone oxidoreductase subunit J
MLDFFLILILISAFCVIFSKNIIQSVLYLILVFLLCSLLFIYLGAEFIGLIILIVYIGAIAVLFLFVIMMLNIRVLELSSTFSIYLPLACFLSLLFFFEIIYIYNLFFFEKFNQLNYISWDIYMNSKIVALGDLLFNECFLLFIGATFLLFIAMIGAIILTLDKKYLNLKELNYRINSKNVIWKFKK